MRKEIEFDSVKFKEAWDNAKGGKVFYYESGPISFYFYKPTKLQNFVAKIKLLLFKRKKYKLIGVDEYK